MLIICGIYIQRYIVLSYHSSLPTPRDDIQNLSSSLINELVSPAKYFSVLLHGDELVASVIYVVNVLLRMMGIVLTMDIFGHK